MPAPRPVRITHGDAGFLGLLGYASGQAAFQNQRRSEDMAFLNAEMNRRQQANQFAQRQMFDYAQLEATQQANALQNAYRNRPGSGQQVGMPEQLKQRQAADHIKQMLAQGMIDPETAARMQLGVMSGSPTLAQLGQRGADGGMSEYQRNKMLVDAAVSEEQAARAALQDFVNGTMGGLTRIEQDPNLRAQYQQLQDDYAGKRDQAIQLRRQLASGQRTGAVPGLPGGGGGVPQPQPGQGQPQPGGRNEALGTVNGLPFVASPADLDKVPSGSQFVAPDGSVRRKP